MPKYFQRPFAENGDRAEIPEESASGAVNFDTGYTLDYELPKNNPNRKAIERPKNNGLYHAITANLKHWQEIGVPEIVADAGGGDPLSYSRGFVGALGGVVYEALVNGTTTVPPSAEWQVYDLRGKVTALADITSIAALNPAALTANQAFDLQSWRPAANLGGDRVHYDPSRPQADHDGGTVFALGATPPTDFNDPAQIEAYLNAGSGLSGGGCLVREEKEALTPSDFGASPELSNNAAPLMAAIASGELLDWGDLEYPVTERVGADATLPHEIRWKSSGARVVLDGTVDHIADVIAYRITRGDHWIKGEFTIDASSKANICFGLRNTSTASYPSGYATFKAEGIALLNSRRESGFRAGGGARIEGAFTWVVLDCPKVRNAVLATGAGVQGSNGITGIDITRDSDTGLYPLYSEIVNPDVDGVESEDLDYEFDQDGLKVFGGMGATDLLSSFSVEGGQFRNCFGRSVKSQTATGTVTNTKFIRNRGFNADSGNPEIDFQNGMGFVHDITCDYDGFVPSTVVGQRSADVNRAQGLVDGVAVKVRNAVLPTIVSTFSAPPMAPVVSRNLSTEGPIGCAVQLRSPQAVSYITLEDFNGDDIRDGLVQAETGGIDVEATEEVRVDIRRAFNTGAPVLAVRQRIPGNAVTAVLSAEKLVGFTGGDIVENNPTEETGPKIVKRLEALTMTEGGNSGYLEMQAEDIAVDATVQFRLPPTGLAFFNARLTDAVAVFSFSTTSGGRLGELFSGGDVSIGSASEPAENTFQVWPDTVNSLINVKNNSTGTRTVTIMYFTA